jgi:hypothetical protein
MRRDREHQLDLQSNGLPRRIVEVADVLRLGAGEPLDDGINFADLGEIGRIVGGHQRRPQLRCHLAAGIRFAISARDTQHVRRASSLPAYADWLNPFRGSRAVARPWGYRFRGQSRSSR